MEAHGDQMSYEFSIFAGAEDRIIWWGIKSSKVLEMIKPEKKKVGS
jgi:hypothetical protein